MHGGREHRGMTYRSCGRFNRFNGQRKTSVGSHAESRVHTGRAGYCRRESSRDRCSSLQRYDIDSNSRPANCQRAQSETETVNVCKVKKEREKEKERERVCMCMKRGYGILN